MAYKDPFLDIRSKSHTTNNGDPDWLAIRENEIKLLDLSLYAYKRLFKFMPSKEGNSIWPTDCSSNQEVEEKIDNAISKADREAKKVLLVELSEYEHKRIPKDPDENKAYRLWGTVKFFV